MIVRKRDGRTVEFDKSKIYDAIMKAMKEVNHINERTASRIANEISKEDKEIFDIEEIQDLVESKLMASSLKDVAKAYILYRNERSRKRELKTTLKRKNEQLKNLINGTDEASKKENSNKDTTIIPTMRDYVAGFTCRELAEAYYFPQKIIDAHKNGEIHIHDTDYSPVMPMTNCCLVNLDDMLQNGTVISGTMIEKPHSFATACNIATQIITQVASSQYGGTSINMAHIAPFVEESRKTYKKKFPFLTDEQIEQFIKKEIADGVQTIQYQLITMSTTNG